ncbi:MAG TPA: bifunctional metallophosphatase/5'-nucleotidase [Sphingobium sp.]|uniref:bifunctional metallophosphatase/5'-nucleotidase n=1 Tax=Sphingobium sp. TaxID=1912891 RepID=UPI002ED58098
MHINCQRISSVGALLLFALSACSPSMEGHRPGQAGIGNSGRQAADAQSRAIPVRIIAFNDFHGNLEPPRQAITLRTPDGPASIPAGGAAYLASAVAKLKAGNPLNLVVSAGDLTGASPLISSLFLDEPTVRAMNLIGLDLNAVGNHEFDRGQDELLRLQKGGCQKFTRREPCQIDKAFPGASFRYLAANAELQNGRTLFPPYAIRSFRNANGEVRIGFIGMTLKGTADIVSAAGVAGIHFADEAKTANALIPQMRKEGANIIVLLIHQGGSVTAPHGDQSCAGLEGDIIPVLDALDPAVDIVISGHTHRDYICEYGKVNPARPLLLTSAGQYGTLLTSIDLLIDPATHRLLSRRAENHIVQGEGFTGAKGAVPVSPLNESYPPDAGVKALVDRYKTASAAASGRVVGHAAGPMTRAKNDAGEQVLGELIADAQLAALRGPGGAELAFMNQGGVRADLVPGDDGAVTFGMLYAIQPFGNILTVKTFTGQQVLDLLEQQFRVKGSAQHLLLPSANVHYSYDWTRPAGSKVSDVTIDGKAIDRNARYRVATSQFLGDGGDGFTTLAQGTAPFVGPADLEALEAYFAATKTVSAPTGNRVRRLDAPLP